MGKNGALMRAAKAQNTTYTFTRAQLEEHDRQVRQAAIERKMKDLKEYAHEVITNDFNEQRKLFDADAEEAKIVVFSMLVSISCRVLVERFGWEPADDDSTEENRLIQFALAVQEEAQGLLDDELLQIRKYAEEAWEITGVRLEVGEVDDEI